MPDNNSLVLSVDRYKFWCVDHVKRQITIVPQDGDAMTRPLEGDKEVPGINLSVFDWEKWWVTTVTNRNDLVITAGFNADRPDTLPQTPTVYLDQNKWSLLARSLWAPERVSDTRELAAAKEIVRLASDDGICLPLSSAHLLETTALHTDLRYEIGVTLAQLSGGWQMRHPLDVFEQEAIGSLDQVLSEGETQHDRRTVLTTEPNAWRQWTQTFGIRPAREGTVELFLEMISAPGAVVALLVNPEPIARTHLEQWVEHHEAITRSFKSLSAQKSQKRATALRRFWNEHLSVYRSAWTTLGHKDAPSISNKDLKELLRHGRMTSLLSELYITRFIDTSTRWHRNDLVDMLFLSCGAAYCDYVVGEAKTVNHLAQIQRSQSRPRTVFRTLSELVDVLHANGVKTDSERRNQIGVDGGGTGLVATPTGSVQESIS